MNHLTSLARHLPRTTPMGESALRALSARVWHDHGIVCLKPETLTNDFDKQAVINAAEKLYGKRDKG